MSQPTTSEPDVKIGLLLEFSEPIGPENSDTAGIVCRATLAALRSPGGRKVLIDDISAQINVLLDAVGLKEGA